MGTVDVCCNVESNGSICSVRPTVDDVIDHTSDVVDNNECADASLTDLLCVGLMFEPSEVVRVSKLCCTIHTSRNFAI